MHLHLPLMVGGVAPRKELGRAVRPDERRHDLGLPVHQCQGVGHVGRNAPQGGDGLTGAGAGLQQVAHDQRDAEALADDLTAAEGQRDREPGRVDAVGRTCDPLHGRHHPLPGPGAAQDPRLVQARVEIVVAHQERTVAIDYDGL